MTSLIGGSTIEEELSTLFPWTERAPAIAPDEYRARLDKARSLTAKLEGDALIIGAGASLRYFASVGWGASERLVALVLPPEGDPVIICPKFELGTLSSSLAIDGFDIRCWEEDDDPYALTAQRLAEIGARRVLIDPALAFTMASRLGEAARGVELIDATPVIDGCRSIKSPAEIALMQQAKSMTLEVHRRTARMLRPGLSTEEARRFIDDAHRRIGAAGSSFCIVLFGEASSYPHGVPYEQYLKEGDIVLIDTGCTVQGYNSDITRTYVFGEPSAEHRRIWALEKEAQQAAFEAAHIGAPCETVDAAARKVIADAGFGPDYRLPGLPHRTGHGIGLSVHEAPYLVRGDKTPLAPGMCFSNEPMIVIPGAFGVRLEDHFHMTDAGPRWFTKPSPSIDQPF